MTEKDSVVETPEERSSKVELPKYIGYQEKVETFGCPGCLRWEFEFIELGEELQPVVV